MSGPLEPYRVLDVTTERGWLTGKLLRDLGADVVKVEPPGGDPGRRRPPFHGGEPDPERSLRWWFFNRGKRSVTLDPATADGRALLWRLAATADVLIESFEPGWMEEWGLGYDALAAQSPRLVYTSVTPFGRSGPYAGFRGPDLVIGALGGQVWLNGDPGRPPVRLSVPQYELHGAAEAAVHTTIALYHAAATGDGQHVDVAAQLACIRTLMNATGYPVLEGRDVGRAGGARATAAASFRMIYPCRDGHVTLLLGGLAGVRAFVDWMREEGEVPGWLDTFDWENTDFARFARTPEGREFFQNVEGVLEAFFREKTKAELYDEALKRRFLLAPVNTVADIRTDSQLEFRGYFQGVDHGPLGEIAYAGPWAKLSGTPIEATPRAPRIGEHNGEVLSGELGLSAEDLTRLAGAGVL